MKVVFIFVGALKENIRSLFSVLKCHLNIIQLYCSSPKKVEIIN